jgi:hypothetical protein
VIYCTHKQDYTVKGKRTKEINHEWVGPKIVYNCSAALGAKVVGEVSDYLLE